ncbi:SusC/RagA family TonB-linked outer membrane protein [Aureibaculum marinum]|uniref:SusC/RagA family TonB-linked outer membrane protein n=1 Tax=Aureibaculum marinum TaxID=2487930 RepID=A0A3N4P5M0_9FLAO|nr:SusC/RagA family TonB-linked outer membrane protein [Aureibaculum marinum]RPE00177.1 SusC/RagA family TonB-linked outer membrane protein [Aureibaculum marinum]
MRNFKNALFGILFLFPLIAIAQISIKGKVTEQSTGTELPGVNVIVKGTTNGTVTDFDGLYAIDNVNIGDILVFSFVGFKNFEVTINSNADINVALEEAAQTLEEVVIIGYGTTTKKDATGSVSSVKAEEINKGAIASPEQLLVGKIAGVQVTTGGGAPGTGSTIRIRGGSSLTATNNPLIIIDGVPIDNDGVSGTRNPLNIVNPNDIESYSVLKDASATAIYGSRASNGVIIITTKKGKSGGIKTNYSANVSVQENTEFIDAMSATDFKAYVNANGLPSDIALLGNSETNWQKEIFKTGLGTDHNISLSGGSDKFNVRGSMGYTNLNGTLKTSKLERATYSLNMGTKLFDNKLKIDVNTKASLIANRFADNGAIGNAISFDPTQSIYDDSLPFGGFFEWTNPVDGRAIQTGAPRNPVALLAQRRNESSVKRFIGNIQFDYKMHFLPDLRANLNLGIDKSSSHGHNNIFNSATTELADGTNLGNMSTYNQDKENKLLDFYLNYIKYIESIDSKIDVMAGYSYQDFLNEGESVSNLQNKSISETTDYSNVLNLQSFFGRLNYTLANKYLFTFTYRTDGSSRFRGDNKWGKFPSAAFAWKMNEESFLQDSNTISDLKLRLGWGVTGQQDIGVSNPSLATYLLSTNTAQYQFGNSFLSTYRAERYNTTLKWEETTTYNLGLDFGFFNDRINGSIDGYFRETTDLLNFISFPAGSALSNADYANIGNLENKGVELTLNLIPIQTDDLDLTLSLNGAWNDSEITKLTTNESADYEGEPTGGISGGVGNNVQIHSVGYAPNTFYVYEQVYDANGKPLEDVYVDRNGDGSITLDDRYRYKNPNADITLGFATDLNYKNWNFTMSWRGSFGNYVYNNVDSNLGFKLNLLNTAFPDVISNGVENILETGFVNGGTERYLSDYYVQDASFVKLDNVGLGYNFNNVFGEGTNLKLNATVQNVLTITDYEGLDPEVFGGIDYNIYPRPRIYTLGLNLNF